MVQAHRRDRAQLVISAAVIALGLFTFYQTQLIKADGGYSTLGPRFSPLLVAGALLLIGVLLLRQALTGGWRNMEAATPPEPFFAPAFGWIVGGLAINMVVIGFVGFTLASAVLFVMVTRGFGSRRLVRDGVIGLGLAAIVFVVFTRVLGLALPASPAGFI